MCANERRRAVDKRKKLTEKKNKPKPQERKAYAQAQKSGPTRAKAHVREKSNTRQQGSQNGEHKIRQRKEKIVATPQEFWGNAKKGGGNKKGNRSNESADNEACKKKYT